MKLKERTMATLSFKSQFVNSQKTLFGVSDSERGKMDKFKCLTLFIEGLSPLETSERMVKLLGEFVGEVSIFSFIKREDSDIRDAVVRFLFWYDDVFTRTLRSELIMANEHNKHWQNQEVVTLAAVIDSSEISYKVSTSDEYCM